MSKDSVAKVVWPVVEDAMEMVDTCAWRRRGVSGKFRDREDWEAGDS